MSFIKNFITETFTPLLTASQFYESGVLTPEEFVRAGDHLVKTCQTWQWASGLPANARNYLPSDKQYLITRNVPSTRRAKGYLAGNREELVKLDTGDAEGKGDEWTIAFADNTDGASQTSSVESKSAVAGTSLSSATANKSPAKLADDDIPELLDSDEEDAAPAKPKSSGSTGTASTTSSTATSAPETAAAVSLEDDDDDATLTVAGHKVGATSPTTTDGAVMVVNEPAEKFVKTRTYDISIVYDRYYRTPRVYLFGYNEHGQPLTYDEVTQDISADHAGKTITQESHPLTGVTNLSIHPCRHAHTMKRLLDNMYEHELEIATAAQKAAEEAAQRAKAERDADLAKWSGTGVNVRSDVPIPGAAAAQAKPNEIATAALKAKMPVENYMFLFLKFISSVLPTIEYDYTLSLSL